jgi:hypothetical protein
VRVSFLSFPTHERTVLRPLVLDVVPRRIPLQLNVVPRRIVCCYPSGPNPRGQPRGAGTMRNENTALASTIRRSLPGREKWMSWRVIFRNRHRDIRSAEGPRQSCCRHGQNYTKVAARLNSVYFFSLYQWQTATRDGSSKQSCNAGGSVARCLSSLSSLSLGGFCRVMAVHES